MYGEEKEIYHKMKMVSADSNYHIPNLNLNSQADDRATTFGPSPHPFNTNKPRSQIPSQQATQRSVTPTPNPKENIYKKSAIDDLKTERNNEQEEDYTTSPRVHQYYQATPMGDTVPIGDDYMVMIEAIEKKAMQEI